MSISISGSNSISGLSGNDTNFDKVLEQLKQIESTQLRRLEAWKSDWNLRYEAFGQIIDQVQAASNMLSSLSNKNNFVTKNVTSSNENIVTAVANASAQDVQHAINVTQVASNAIWANIGHTFGSKDDVINTSGSTQKFEYTYAGKRYSVDIPNKTTLDSFVNLVNNDVNNPGVKVSLIQTGSGYVFQVAGKDTGSANDLIIHNTGLVGMDATGTSSTWVTNNALNLTEGVTNPTQYVFDVVLDSGVSKSITIRGDATAQEVVDAFNNAAGGISASLDSTGNLIVAGVQSFTRRTAADSAYKAAGLNVRVGNLNEALLSSSSNEELTFSVLMNNGKTREFTISGGASKKTFLAQLAQATQDSDTVDIGMDSDGSWSINLSGVTSISQTSGTDASLAYTSEKYDGTKKDDYLIASISGNTTLTFGTNDSDGTDNISITDRLSDDEQALRYTLVRNDGSAVYVDFSSEEVKNGATYKDLYVRIKSVAQDKGIAFIEDGTNQLTLNGITSFRLTTGSGAMAGITAETKSSFTISKDDIFYTDSTGAVLLEEPPSLQYTITLNDGSERKVTVDSGKTMNEVISQIQGELTGTGASARLVDANGAAWVDEQTSGAAYLEFQNVQSVTGPGIRGQVATSTNWSIQRAANARYQIDNWPLEMESETNQVSDVIEGVIFSIQDTGAARISVSTDVTSVEQSIQNFLDAINSVLLTINELTAYDEDKEVTSNDPNDMGNDNYSASGLTNQKGSLLTGNYGVQLLKSRFTSLLISSPAGFQSRTTAEDILSGDVLATLANLGIKMDNTTTSDTYGFFVIAPASGIAELQNMDAENYNNMITNNLEAVVDFFCASGSGSSSTSDFRYGSHVEGITKAGVYDVEYEVDGNGNITSVTVGGVEATRDTSQPGYYYSVASGDARGLSILIDNLEPTTPGNPHKGQVRIKEGLVQTVNNFLKAELNYTDVNVPTNASPQEYADAVALKSKNGALMVLRENYRNIMENIDAKIEKEQYRISVWESRQKQIFANLETLLAQYGEQQKTLESQLAQLGNGD